MPELEGITLYELALADLAAKPEDPAPFIPLDAFIHVWLPKMLHAPITRISVQIPQGTPGFTHLGLVVRSDFLDFPEAERHISKMLVHFGHIDLTVPARTRPPKARRS